ncbi:unnamed protein product [Chironomus riparius]|uniref:Uncharacterized protein n=1 Tax=Chironomus riparius TaxID=315576 RepID=A0A9P0IYB1_9DIPT|nr:unnamed protein product [Chironomus riparius]
MNNYGYLIVMMTLISIVMGQQRFIGHRTKSKFRPRPEWFGEMLPKPESIVYEEQNDAPLIAINSNDSPFQDFVLEDYETQEKIYANEEVPKLPRQSKEPEVFQNICPSIKRVVIISQDPSFEQEYEYSPNVFMEVSCLHPYTGKANTNHHRSINRVCRKNYGECIQGNSTLHLSRRLKVAPGEVNENCWIPYSKSISSNCECMWSKHKLGDILKAHINLDDE